MRTSSPAERLRRALRTRDVLCAFSALVALATPCVATAEPWSFAVSGLLFAPPDEDAYFAPTLVADRGPLHLEARYNYEDLRTGSLFAGRNFDSGGELSVTATPLFGLVVGQTTGIAPGLELDVEWRALALYAESEYVIHLEEDDADFFYTWLEATIAPVSWLRAGLVAQRTRTFDSDLDVQRGLLVEATYGALSAGLDWFNPDRPDDRYIVAAVGYEF